MWHYNATNFFGKNVLLLQILIMASDLTGDIKKGVGKNLKRIRQAAKLSLRELDSELGIDYSHLSKMERGEFNITLETIAIFVKFYKIEPKELFDFKLENEPKYYD